jgi:riboflavin synthase
VFTGLIADLGSVAVLERDDDGATLQIATALADQIAVGDSVAINGVCLTATAVDGGGFQAQAIAETLRRSSLGELHAGSPVNLELALRADGRLGGHIVQGHVDGTGTVAQIQSEGFARLLTVALADGAASDGAVSDGAASGGAASGGAASGVTASTGSGRDAAFLARYLVEKGSIAIDGVSLTISALQHDRFSVSLIPETLQRTNLGRVAVGQRVNLEVDILAKHVERLMEART